MLGMSDLTEGSNLPVPDIQSVHHAVSMPDLVSLQKYKSIIIQ